MKELEKIKNIFLNNEIIIFLSFMFLMKPSAITTFSTINLIYNIFSFLVILIIFILFFDNLIHKKISKIQGAILLFILSLGFSTLIGTKDFYFFLKQYSNLFAVSIYTEMLILNNPKKLLKPLSILIMTYIIINFGSVLFLPKRFFPNKSISFYFLGYDNSTVHIIVLGMYVLLFASHYFYNKITMPIFITLIIAVLTYFKLWAASCMICISIVILFICFVYKKNLWKKIFNYKVLLSISLLLFIGIVILRWQNIFSWLIVNVLHKNMTLTGRTEIWDRCFKEILNHPIFGLGVQSYKIRASQINIYHAHSTLLQILLEGGIVSLFAFLNIFRVVGEDFNMENIKKNEYINICSFAIFTYFISGLVDVIDNTQMTYIILNLSFYAMYIYNSQLKEKKKGKNILIVSGGHLPIPAVMGGAVETLIESYISENEKKYHDNIDLLSVKVPTKYQQLVKKYNYTKFIYINNQSKNSIYNIWCRLFKKINYYIGDYYINKGIKKIKNNNTEYDIILCENEPLYTIKLKKNFNCQIILHLHNDVLNPQRKYYKKVIKCCDKIFTVSDYIKNQVNNKEKCLTTYNGIDFALFNKKEEVKISNNLRKKYHISKNDFVFIFVGRIVPEKGVEELIDAFLKLNQKYHNVKLLLIGSPSFKAKSTSKFYEKMLSKKNDNIIFTGFIENSELYKYYNISNVQVMPSIVKEAFGLTIIEALIMNKKVIVTNSGALPEIMDKSFGYIVEKENMPNSLYEKMELAYLNKKPQKIAKEKLRIYSKEEYAKRIHNGIISVIKGE